MRILIYGAGVIGCLYAALLSEAGHSVCVLARGKRLNSLARDGLRYRAGQAVKTARRIRENLCLIRAGSVKLSPKKLNLLARCPGMLMAMILSWVFQSEFGDRFMCRHSMKAPQEMRRLREQLYSYLGTIRGGR